MSKTTSVTLRMDSQLKRKSEQLFEELGLNMTTAVTVFLKTAVRQGKIPFEIAYGREMEQPVTQPTPEPAPQRPSDDPAPAHTEQSDESVWEIEV